MVTQPVHDDFVLAENGPTLIVVRAHAWIWIDAVWPDVTWASTADAQAPESRRNGCSGPGPRPLIRPSRTDIEGRTSDTSGCQPWKTLPSRNSVATFGPHRITRRPRPKSAKKKEKKSRAGYSGPAAMEADAVERDGGGLGTGADERQRRADNSSSIKYNQRRQLDAALPRTFALQGPCKCLTRPTTRRRSS